MDLMNFIHSNSRNLFISFSLLTSISFSTFAIDAPSASQIQGFRSSEAGIVGRNIIKSPPPTTVQAMPSVQPTPPQTPAISAEAAKYSFVLKGVHLEGNSVYSNDELQSLFKPYLNHEITVAKLQGLVQDITNKYQEAGYFLSKAFLPPQEIANGVVQVRIVEGYISQIAIQGVKSERLIKFINEYGDKIKVVRPVKLTKLERYLLLLNDIPGFSIKSVIEPDPSTPLGSKLTLVSKITPLQATLQQDNYQTPYLGPNESTAFGSLNSFILPGGTIYMRALTADQQHKLSYYELRHDQTIGPSGLVLTVDGYTTKTNPQFILAPLQIMGASDDANVAVSYPIIRSRERNLSIAGQFDYMNNSSNALGEQLYYDLIRDVTITTTYNDTLWKGDDAASLILDKGFSSLGHNRFHSRLDAVGDYLKIVGTLSRTQYLKDTRFSLYAFVTAQYANKILPSAETFTFGGPYLGRGYDWSQFTGDMGVAGKTEFRMSFNPNFPLLKQIQYYTFFDIGELTSLIPRVTRVSGASTGFGLRAMLMNHLNAEGFVGKPLTFPNASQVVQGKTGHDFMGFFQLTAYL